MANWIPIGDCHIRGVWVCDTDYCPSKGKPTYIDPSWYADNGTPMCTECNDDMAYSHTEINL